MAIINDLTTIMEELSKLNNDLTSAQEQLVDAVSYLAYVSSVGEGAGMVENAGEDIKTIIGNLDNLINDVRDMINEYKNSASLPLPFSSTTHTE